MKRFFRKIVLSTRQLFKFLSYGIWHIETDKEGKKQLLFFNLIKAFILTIRNINAAQLSTRASALTYSTLLSIVPLLAVLFGIANGFGFHDTVKSQLFAFFAGQEAVIKKSMDYIQMSIQYSHEGIFLGIGLVLLFYTVISLMMDIETNFNLTWNIHTNRSFYRMFTDYLALVIIAPIFLVCNAGLTLFMSSADLGVISVMVNPFIKIIPFIITILLFTFILAYIPNTRVKFSAALLGGIFSGVGFQIFQILYMGGQIWISKYNTIYGSFAALPLLLLWLQLTWFLILIGVELSFSFQNINKYNYEHETENISERYNDFVMLMVTSLIVKRFANAQAAYTADEISQIYKIPTRLNNEVLAHLLKVGLIEQVATKEDKVFAYMPAVDINMISIGYFFAKINSFGAENFPIDTQTEFKKEWDMMLNLTDYSKLKEGKILLKDL